MIHRVKKGTKTGVIKTRRTLPSALDKLRKKPGFREQMLDEARKEQDPDIASSPMGIVDCVQKKIETEKPKAAKLMKRDRRKSSR